MLQANVFVFKRHFLYPDRSSSTKLASDRVYEAAECSFLPDLWQLPPKTAAQEVQTALQVISVHSTSDLVLIACIGYDHFFRSESGLQLAICLRFEGLKGLQTLKAFITRGLECISPGVGGCGQPSCYSQRAASSSCDLSRR